MKSVKSELKSFRDNFYSNNLGDTMVQYSQLQEIVSRGGRGSRLIQEHREFQKMSEDIESFNSSMELLYSVDWETILNSHNILVEARKTRSSFVTRASLLIESSVFEVLSIICEPDLTPSWVGIFDRVEVLAEPSAHRKLAKFFMNLPQPLHLQEVCLEFVGFPVPQEEAYLIIMRSPNPQGFYRDYDISGKVRMNIGCFYVQKIAPTLTKVVLTSDTGSYLNRLPTWLSKFGSKRIMYYLMDGLSRQVRNLRGSIYEQRIGEKQAFYNWLQSMC